MRMNTVEGQTRNLEWVSGILAISTTIAVLAVTIIPYFNDVPEKNHNLIVQGQTTLWNGWLIILGFYFGTTLNSRKNHMTAEKQADTVNALVKGNLDPSTTTTTSTTTTGNTVELEPGEKVNVEAKTE